MAAIAVGEFGAQVSDLLPSQGIETTVAVLTSSDREAVEEIVSHARASGADAVVLCAWRETPSVAEWIEAAAIRCGLPWLPAVMAHPYVRVGPLVAPGGSGCYRCFCTRMRENDPQAELTAALHREYDREDEVGVYGHLGAHSAFAAVAVAMLIGALSDDAWPWPAGDVLWSHVSKFGAARDRAIGIDQCDRCGGRSAGLQAALMSRALGRPDEANEGIVRDHRG